MFKSINGGRLPERATKYSAGFDVFANEDVVIGAGETKLVGLGIAFDNMQISKAAIGKIWDLDLYTEDELYFLYIEPFVKNHYFALHIRSSLRAKGLTSLGTGIIDMDYRDEIKMVIHNPFNYFEIERHDAIRANTRFDAEAREIIRSNPSYEIKKGDKIGQLILCRHEGWLLPEEYTKDEERTGGLGSTDQ